ncbi:MAG: NosD domain-containing protein [Thermoproteota archaeon]
MELRKLLILTIILLPSIASLTVSRLSVEAGWSNGTINIKEDGSIDPSDAPIRRDGKTYVLTDDIIASEDGIIIERDNIILDGNGHRVTGPFSFRGRGISLSNRVNVTIRNVKVEGFHYGIFLASSSNNTIANNTFSNNTWNGIRLDSSSNDNTVLGNVLINNGLFIWYSYSNTVLNNTVNGKPLVYLEGVSGLTVNNAGQVILVNCRRIRVVNLNLSNATVGVELLESSENTIANNTLSNNLYGICLYNSSGNTITGNTISKNRACGIRPYFSSNNNIYNNDFINNALQVSVYQSINSWDDSSRGNYWSNYTGVDTNNDGLGDTPYKIDSDNADRHPLMRPFTRFEFSSLNINPDSIKVGQSSTISVIIRNTGRRSGTFNVTLKVNNQVVKTETGALDPDQSTTVSFFYAPTSEGTYAIDVNGLTGSLTVSKEELPLLIIIGVVAVAVVALAIILLRRKPKAEIPLPPPPPPPVSG